MTNSFLLKMAIEIVRFPRYKMVISRRCLYVYQRVVAFPVTYQTGEDARNSSMKIWEKTHTIGRLAGWMSFSKAGHCTWKTWKAKLFSTYGGFLNWGVPKNRGFLMENIIQIWGKQHSLWLQQL